MSVSSKVKSALALCGKKQIDLAAYFGMSKQVMNNKMSRDSWSASDLARVAEYLGGRLVLELQSGQVIVIEPVVKEATNKEDPDE